jgi:hypothetical protein
MMEDIHTIMVERHPLRYSGMSCAQIFPFLSYFQSKKKPLFESQQMLDSDGERSDTPKLSPKASLRKNRIELTKLKSRKGFLTLGYAFVAYFSFLEWLIVIFTALTLLSLPSLYYYMTFRKDMKEDMGLLGTYSMGNLGYVSALCRDVHLEVGTMVLSWPTGEITDIISLGVIPSNSKIQDACFPNPETSSCDPSFPKDGLLSFIKALCLGQKTWVFDIRFFFEGDHKEVKGWRDKGSRFYTQAFWKINDQEEMDQRKYVQKVLIITTIISALVYLLSLEVLDVLTLWNEEKYDISTTTSSDFTAEYEIPPEMFANFKTNIYPLYKVYLKSLHKR